MNFYNYWLAHGPHYHEPTFRHHVCWSLHLMQMHCPEMSVCKFQIERRPFFYFAGRGGVTP